MVLACSEPPEPGPTAGTGPTPSTGESGGQSGEDSASCEETVTIGGPSDVLVGAYGGFTAEQLRTLADGTFEASVGWSDGETTALVLELLWAGEIRLVEASPEGCGSRIEIDGIYTSTTADGRLAEAGTAVLEGRQSAVAGFAITWDEKTFGGTLVFPTDVSTLEFETTIDAAGARGGIVTPEGDEVASFGP